MKDVIIVLAGNCDQYRQVTRRSCNDQKTFVNGYDRHVVKVHAPMLKEIWTHRDYRSHRDYEAVMTYLTRRFPPDKFTWKECV